MKPQKCGVRLEWIWLIFLLIAVEVGKSTFAIERQVPSVYSTIQSAIDASNNGDVVIIAPGTYTGNGNRDIDFKGKAITVRSTSPQDHAVVASTIINCQGSQIQPHRGFYFHSGETTNSVVSGLKIINGYGEYGGGIYCTYNSSFTISFCYIMGNTAKESGGGIRNSGVSPIISNCLIENNTANWGGGISHYGGNGPQIAGCLVTHNTASASAGGIDIEGGSSTIVNCMISHNTAQGYHGGGLVLESIGLFNLSSSPKVLNCVITGNIVGYYGGGIYSGHNSPIITNCTIVGNWAQHDSGGGFHCFNSDPTINNCIIWNNYAPNGQEIAVTSTNYPSYLNIYYSNVRGDVSVLVNPGCTLTWVAGNIFTNPLFVDAGHWTQSIWIDGDYHLQPGSLCINGGHNASISGYDTDMEGQPRISDAVVDIGAFEFQTIEQGTLTIDTSPVKGEIFVDGESWGIAPQSGEVTVGDHDISVGNITGYTTPAAKQVIVNANQTTDVTFNYIESNDLLIAWGQNTYGQCPLCQNK